MKRNLKPYLIFPGTCREALTFYARCLGGEILALQTYGESPLEIPEDAGNRVFNAAFRADGIQFMASDNLPANDVASGSNFALFVAVSDAAELGRMFAELATGGKVVMPLDGGFGMVQDRYDIRWMLAFDNEG